MANENLPTFEDLQAFFNAQGFLHTIGAELTYSEPGKVIISCPLTDALTQQNGYMHAGVISTVADVTCGMTALSALPKGYNMLSVELNMNLMRPMTGSCLVATGKLIRLGRSIAVAEAEVINEDNGKLVSKMTATLMPMPPKED